MTLLKLICRSPCSDRQKMHHKGFGPYQVPLQTKLAKLLAWDAVSLGLEALGLRSCLLMLLNIFNLQFVVSPFVWCSSEESRPCLRIRHYLLVRI